MPIQGAPHTPTATEPCKDCGCMAMKPGDAPHKDCKRADCPACHPAKEMALQTRDLNGVEVFGIGEWNGIPISSRDLDTIVESFKKTWQRLKPSLWLGHEKDQKIIKNTGLPSAGWVEGLRRVGNKLVADFKRVPAKVAALIEAGAYRRVSVGLLDKYRMGDEVFDMALYHIGLLGAATPAVDNLDDIIALYGADYKTLSFNAEAEAKEVIFDREAPVQDVEDAMTEKELETLRSELAGAKLKIAEFDAKLSKSETEKAEKEKELAGVTAKFTAADSKSKELEASLAKEKTRADTAEAQVSEFKAKARKSEIEAKVDGLIKGKKLLPAQKDFAIAFLEKGVAQGEMEFALGDKKFKSPEELLFAMLDAGASVHLNDGERTDTTKSRSDEAKGGIVGEDFDRKVQAYAKEHKVSYRDAYATLKRAEAEAPKA